MAFGSKDPALKGFGAILSLRAWVWGLGFKGLEFRVSCVIEALRPPGRFSVFGFGFQGLLWIFCERSRM